MEDFVRRKVGRDKMSRTRFSMHPSTVCDEMKTIISKKAASLYHLSKRDEFDFQSFTKFLNHRKPFQISPFIPCKHQV